MSFYEHTLVAKQDLSSDEINKIHHKYSELINASSGKVLKVEEWGMLNFASKIKNYNRGYYIHYKFEGNASTLNQIKKNSNIDGSILRHLTIKYKKLDLTQIQLPLEFKKNTPKKFAKNIQNELF